MVAIDFYILFYHYIVCSQVGIIHEVHLLAFLCSYKLSRIHGVPKPELRFDKT